MPPFSPAERPDEEDGVGEEVDPEPELEPELEPAGEEGLAWPGTVEEAAVAGPVGLVNEYDGKMDWDHA